MSGLIDAHAQQSAGNLANAIPATGNPLPRAIIPRIDPLAVASVAPLAFNPSAVRVPAIVARLRAKKITPQEAWQSGEIDVDDLFYFLNHSLDMWGGFTWEQDPALRRALVGLLVQHGGARLDKAESLSATVRLWLADYYGSIKDERALSLAESILAEVKEPVKGENPLIFQATEQIAWFYRDIGQFEKAAQAWLRLEKLHQDTGWWVPDAYVEAARLYSRGGQTEKAQALYAQVPKYGDGWLAGMASWDQANSLIAKGEHEQARKILQQPVVGSRAEQMRVGFSSLLGDSYYRTRDFEIARKYSQEAIDRYQALKNPPQDAGFIALVSISKQRLERIDWWKKAPIICTPSELRFGANASQPMTEQLQIRSFEDIPLSITSENPKIRVTQTDKGKQIAFDFVKSVTINYESNVMASNPLKVFDSTLIVRSPKFPQFSVRVPVYFDVPKTTTLMPPKIEPVIDPKK